METTSTSIKRRYKGLQRKSRLGQRICPLHREENQVLFTEGVNEVHSRPGRSGAKEI